MERGRPLKNPTGERKRKSVLLDPMTYKMLIALYEKEMNKSYGEICDEAIDLLFRVKFKTGE